MSNCIEIQIVNDDLSGFPLKSVTEFKNPRYLCVNMSTPLPIRTGRLGWTFYFFPYA
jgi:hypothetical protein